MQRKQVEGMDGQLRRLSPTASPTSGLAGLVRPVEDTQTGQLLDALTGVSKTLGMYLADKQQTFMDEERAAGQLARDKSGKELAAAIEAGEVEPSRSKYFLEGYRQQHQRLHAQSESIRAEAQFEVLKARFPEMSPEEQAQEIEGFLSKFRVATLDGLTAEEREAALPVVNQTQQHLFERARSTVNQTMREVVEDNAFTELHQGVLASVAYAGQQGTAIDFAQVAPAIQQNIQAAIDQGLMAGGKAGQVAVDAITMAAVKQGDETLLGLLDHLETIPGSSLGKTKYALEQREKAASAIAREREQANNRYWADLQRKRSEGARAVKQRAFQMLLEDPYANVGPLMAQALMFDPGAASSIQSLRNSMLDSVEREDPRIKAYLYREAMRPDGNLELDDVLSSMIHHDIKPATAKDLMSVREKREELQTRLTTPDINRARDRVTRALRGDEAVPLTYAQAVNLEEALSDWEVALFEWTQENPNASYTERAQMFQELNKRVIDDYSSTIMREVGREMREAAGRPTAPAPKPSNTPQASQKVTMGDIRSLAMGELTDTEFDTKFGPGAAARAREYVRRMNDATN